MPGTSQNLGHYDQLLSTLSHAYVQDSEGFISGKVFPVVPVAKASDVYKMYPRGNFFRDDVRRRPMGGAAAITNFGSTEGTYSTEEDALSAMIDDRERANETAPMSTERSKTKLLTNQHLIHRDNLWAASFFKTGVWSTDVTGVPSGAGAGQVVQWNSASSTPVQDVRKYATTMKRSSGIRPNTLVLGADTFDALADNPVIMDRIKYTERGIVTVELLSSMFGLRVLVADAVQNTAQEGVAESMSFIVNSKGALLAYSAPEPALEMPSAGYTFAWTGLLGAGAGQGQSMAPVFRNRDEAAFSDRLTVRMALDQKVVAPDLGIFFATVVA